MGAYDSVFLENGCDNFKLFLFKAVVAGIELFRLTKIS